MIFMIKKIWNLYKKYEEIINYLIVGGLTTVVSLAVYYGSVLTFLDPNNAVQLQIANILSWVLAVAFAYVTNRIFVFKSKEENIVKECSAFVGSRILTLLMDMFIMFLFVTVLHLNDKVFKIVSQIFVVIGNYLISKLIVFKKKKH